MKRLLNLLISGVVLVAFSGSSLVWGKAHVPLDMTQVCHGPSGDDGREEAVGTVRTVRIRRLERFLRRGSCRLPVCDFTNVFMPMDECSTVDDDGNGFCDTDIDGNAITVPTPIDDSADGVTARCTNPF